MVKNKNSSNKKIIIILIVIILAGTGVAYGLNRSHSTAPDNSAKTTSKAVTAQNNYSSGSSRPTNSGSASQGGAIDEKGVTPPAGTNNTGSPTTSISGFITLQQPSANETLTTGDTIYGTAQVPTVQYRLVDDKVGVLAQGALQVADGKFSGKLQFKAYGSTGTLDVFSFDPTSGAEINRIEVKVAL